MLTLKSVQIKINDIAKTSGFPGKLRDLDFQEFFQNSQALVPKILFEIPSISLCIGSPSRFNLS